MSNSANLGLPFIEAAQAQKHVTHNEALKALDTVVQLAVLDRDFTAAPGSPANGDRYIVAAGATGSWSGKDGEIAAFQDGAWVFYAPREGWLAWVADEDKLVAWGGSTWAKCQEVEEASTPLLSSASMPQPIQPTGSRSPLPPRYSIMKAPDINSR